MSLLSETKAVICMSGIRNEINTCAVLTKNSFIPWNSLFTNRIYKQKTPTERNENSDKLHLHQFHTQRKNLLIANKNALRQKNYIFAYAPNKYIFTSNKKIFGLSKIIFQTNEIIFHLNKVLFQFNKFYLINRFIWNNEIFSLSALFMTTILGNFCL